MTPPDREHEPWTLGVALVALVATACGAGSVGTKRNAILVSIDSLRADHLSCYGYPKETSPRLDALAREGIRFAHATAPSPWTLPSHASLFTGLYPVTHGLQEEGRALEPDAETLARTLARAGFRTQAVVCAPLLETDFGLDSGFLGYDDELIGADYHEARSLKVGPRVTEKALAFLDAHGGGQAPFFLFLHYWDVHYDYDPPPEYAELFDPGYEGEEDGLDVFGRSDIVQGMDPDDLAHLVALYDGEIRYTDDAIGALLDGLEQRGLADSTLVWITADHGEEFLEHGGKGHTSTCHAEVIDIPMIARVPWIERARGLVVPDPVSLIDVQPTLLELLGVPPAGRVQGTSLVPALRGEALAPRALLAQTIRGRRPGTAEPIRGRRVLWSAVAAGAEQRLHVVEEPGKRPKRLLFDVLADPLEQVDRARDADDRVAVLQRELAQLMEAALALREELSLSVERELDTEVMDTLRGLGYGG